MNSANDASLDATPAKAHRSLSVRPGDLINAQALARQLRIKQSDLLGILLRGWTRLPRNQQFESISDERAAPGGQGVDLADTVHAV